MMESIDEWMDKQKKLNQQNDDSIISDDRKHKVPVLLVMMVSFPGNLYSTPGRIFSHSCCDPLLLFQCFNNSSMDF